MKHRDRQNYALNSGLSEQELPGWPDQLSPSLSLWSHGCRTDYAFVPASALHAVGQVSDLAPPFLFDFARSDAVYWAQQFAPGSRVECYICRTRGLNSLGLPSWILSRAG